MSGPALAVIENLEKASEQELEQMASALFVSDFASVSSDKAPFIWAALSLYWAQMASLIPGKARAEYGEQRQFCPVCGSMPVSSIVQIGTTQGLRYLHCNLCETEWHVVRVKCSNCEQSRDLHYWSLDNEQAAVKAESCGDCGTYLKIMYQEKGSSQPSLTIWHPWCSDARMSRKVSPEVRINLLSMFYRAMKLCLYTGDRWVVSHIHGKGTMETPPSPFLLLQILSNF